MEGTLTVPPERNSFLGKSLWKTRHVVLGPNPRSPRPAQSRHSSSNRMHPALKTLKISPRNVSRDNVDQSDPEALWLSIYKQKGDREPLSSFAVSSIKTSRIEEFSYRKAAAAQSTLNVTLEPDNSSSNRLSRRASQCSAASSSRSRLSSLLFRNSPDSVHTIFDWQTVLEELMMEKPKTSPFDTSFSFMESSGRPSTSTTRPILPQSQGSYISATSSQHDSAVLSPSISIRSSHTGLTSPTSISPNKPLQTFEAHSSPLTESFPASSRHRPDSSVASSSPAVPRETILDRAFKMKYIPDPTSAGRQSIDATPDAPLNSIARFEALMRDMDAHAAPNGAVEAQPPTSHQLPVPIQAQRALDFISNGHTAPPPPSRPRKRPTASRPTSLALPSTRNSIITDSSHPPESPVDRRRSSISIAPGNPLSSPYGNKHATRISFTDFTKRLSESSSTILMSRPNPSGADSNSSKHSSGVSDGSFGCSGEDDGGRGPGDIPPWGTHWSSVSGGGGAVPSWSDSKRNGQCNRLSGSAFGF
ncbi:MAG: hypothetical protein M1825_003084 [Sarcosagium campestre]|nr:MAG: hypothetical protein M1825_003084 [Sarcosagium campestre]